jgi:hypothetical protein
MTLDASQLESLVARVEKATEGSREMDAEVHIACYGDGALDFGMPTGKGGSRVEFKYPHPYVLARSPHYTSSVDAAIALVEKMLPGCNWRIQRQQDRCHAIINREHAEKHFDIWVDQPGATPALALCGSLLRAIEEAGRG